MWYVLNYIPGPGQRRARLPEIIDKFNSTILIEGHSPLRKEGVDSPNCFTEVGQRDQAEEIQYFAPTFISLNEIRGQVKKTEKPLLYHYIFVKGPWREIKRLCMTTPGFSFVINHTGTSRHLSVSDETLEQFKIIARFYSGKLPCYPLDGITLEEGDRVQIVSGPCAGLTGTYISRKGAKSGNVLVSIDGSMAAIVYDVKAEYVRVLEFARNSKRVYDQLDSFANRLKTFLHRENKDETKVENDLLLLSAASSFTRRLEELKIHNPKLDAKLQILLYAAYSLLADKENAQKRLEKYRQLESHVTNPKSRTLYDSILSSLQI